MIALVAAALASPGGFRLDPGVPVNFVQVRQVLVTPSPGVAQTALRAQMTYARAGVDVQLPFVYTWEPSWHDVGFGQLKIGARRWQGSQKRPWAWGVEAAFPIVPWELRVSAWGSAARETLPAVDSSIFVEGSWDPDSPWVVRIALGWYTGPYFGQGGVIFIPTADFGIAKVIPVQGIVSAVFEGELLVDRAAVSVRGLARFDPAPWASLDLGLQVPMDALAAGQKTGMQIVAQARFFQ